ncbi:MAG: hypothetical protein ACK4FE_09165 [Azonexus sp.]
MSLSFYLSAGFAGQYVVYFPALARRLGSASAAILLSRLIFLQTKPFEGEEAPSRRDFAGRWVSLPLAQAAWEAGLGDDELKAARRRLEAAGLIQTDYRRLQHEMRWQVDFDALDALGDELSSCFNSKVEKPLSVKRENHFGESGNSLVDNVNNVFIKAVEAAAPAAAFNIKSTSHPKTASALASLAATNHLAKPDSVLAKTEQTIRRALAAAKGLPDEQAAGIVDALAEEGGWVSSAAARLADAANQTRAGQAPLAVKAVKEQAASVGLGSVGKRWAGLTVRLADGGTAVVGPAGAVKVAGKLILANQLEEMLADGRLKLVEGEPSHPPHRGLAQLQLSQPSP